MSKIPKTALLFLAFLLILQCGRLIYSNKDLFQNKVSENLYKEARVYQFKGQLDSALIFYDLADKAAPNTAEILHERGLLKAGLGKFDEAIVDLNRSIELTTDQRRLETRILNRALTYMEMGNMSAACNDWQKAGKYGKDYIKKYCK